MPTVLRPSFTPLVEALQDLTHWNGISALLAWDQETYMPAKAIDCRSEQLSRVAALAHHKHRSDTFRGMLAEWVNLETGALIGTDFSSLETSFLNEVYRDWRYSNALPESFIETYTKAKAQSQHAWQQAKHSRNYAQFKPHLATIIELTKQKAQYLGTADSAYNVLLDEYEPGLTTSILTPVLDRLKTQTQALLAAYVPTQNHFLLSTHEWGLEAQRELSELILTDMGFDFVRGRLDQSSHPFSTQIHPDDVRITTRFDSQNPFENWGSTMHECGHALYEQGLNTAYFGTPLCSPISYGIHESQSRLWENGIGKHPSFWDYYYPKWVEAFPDILSGDDKAAFLSSLFHVKPSLIRTQADELTYNLHIWIRYELELALFNGDLSVSDLPHEWNAAYTKLLGVTPTHDGEGILQDVHWSCGYFGYFPTYTVGNLYAAMLLQALESQFDLKEILSTGQLGVIRHWLKIHVHQVGRVKSAAGLIRDITGWSLSETPFIEMMKGRLSL